MIVHDNSIKIVYTCHIAQDINKVNKLKKLAMTNFKAFKIYLDLKYLI